MCLDKKLRHRGNISLTARPSLYTISCQQVYCICLLGLSATFDTLDRSISFHCLSSWFGISSFSIQYMYGREYEQSRNVLCSILFINFTSNSVTFISILELPYSHWHRRSKPPDLFWTIMYHYCAFVLSFVWLRTGLEKGAASLVYV